MPLADLADDIAVTATRPDGSAALVTGRCYSCGTAWFPFGSVCPGCAALDPRRELAGPAGTLYSFTTVHVSSARPTPYSLGYVDLDEGVRVLATIESSPEELAVDAPCRLEVGGDGRWWFVMVPQ
jgi:uncharacterized OB-fold protein